MLAYFNYKFENFLETPTSESKTIRIFDKNEVFRYEIEPNVSYFYTKGSQVVIKVEDEKEISLNFENSTEALRSITKLNQVKLLITKVVTDSEYYTKNDLNNGSLDPRYYTKDQTLSLSSFTYYYTKDQSYNTGETYSKFQLNASGQSQVHWNNITNNPFTVSNYTIQGGSNIILDHFISGSTNNCTWTFSIECRNILGIKISHIEACWDRGSGGTIEYLEYSSKSIGDTSDFDNKYTVRSMNGEIQFYLATGTTYMWEIKLNRQSL